MGFNIKATQGTHDFLNQNNIKSELVTKMHEKRPNVADIITDGDIQLVINTPRGKASKADDSYIRKAAIRNKIPYVTTMAAALAAAKGIEAFKHKPTELKSLQEYHKEL
jgi:carbamoyl-phosphate synthase large subunit